MGNYIHGHSKHKPGGRTPEYTAWCNMIRRCTNPNDHAYDRYGGRGIKVHKRWRNSFTNFLKDMGKKPTPKHMLDRINNNGNYEPGNCRWATRCQQFNNRQSNLKITYNGKTKTLAQWCRKLGLPYKRTYQRLMAYGWPVKKALETPRWYNW
jgi:hypothetical protein